MNFTELESTARALVEAGKGILAADESTSTIEKRLERVGVASTPENHRAYREMLFTAPGLGQFISGVILFDETIRQKTADGTPFVEVLKRQGILPGIKVDKGAQSLAGFPGDKITEGLDGLRERLAEYVQLGARFTKWRAVISIGTGIPSATCIESNAQALARFAALCQEAGLVPIVEPEVLMDGDHPIERHLEVTEAAQHAVFQALDQHRVRLEAIILKPNMILSGQDCAQQATAQQVAEATRRCLMRTVPPAVPGIVFLSGGQSEMQATETLNRLNRLGPAPWPLSFSYGRALQNSALKTWNGSRENVRAAQAVLLHRAQCNSSARAGTYSAEMERGAN